MRGLIYLASPYTAKCSVGTTNARELQDWRHLQVIRATASLISRGLLVFSPIIHSVPLVAHGMGTKWADWSTYDLSFINHCQNFAVLKLEGWKESTGVQAELSFARNIWLPLLEVDYETFEIRPFQEK